MNILVLNGSPRGEKSNTYRLTSAFLEGLRAELGTLANIREINVASMHIEPCRGCFGCWTTTPGRCAIRDDMDDILPAMLEADSIIWSFPLYYYGMPSKLKALLDRNLPLNLPYMAQRPDGGCVHPRRYDTEPAQNILISTCGFCAKENNFDALVKQFDILCGGEYPKILCPEGELFSKPELRNRTDEYLSYVNRAGREYAREKRILEGTLQKLDELLYPPDAFNAMADADWVIADGTEQSAEEKLTGAAERFTRQMAATYLPTSFDGTERIFEIYYTDAKAGYQLVLGEKKCEVRAGGEAPYTTRVETPLTVWQDISRGVYSGAQAMMEGKYKTLGDLKLLISWEHYFNLGGSGGSGKSTTKETTAKKTNMTLMIAPWFVLWLLLPFSSVLGGVAGILAAACIQFAGLKWELTRYDAITCLCVPVFGLLALLGAELRVIVPLTYLCFGLLWLGSCFTPIPLSAHYSKNDYNGEDALENKLFMKTNLILTLCWGGLYLITPVWTYFIMCGKVPYLTGLVNTVCPALLGLFTNWFQRWYPAKVARG